MKNKIVGLHKNNDLHCVGIVQVSDFFLFSLYFRKSQYVDNLLYSTLASYDGLFAVVFALFLVF